MDWPIRNRHSHGHGINHGWVIRPQRVTDYQFQNPSRGRAYFTSTVRFAAAAAS